MSEPVELSQVREAQVTLERRLDSLVGQGIRSITVDELGALLAKAKAAKGSGNTPAQAFSPMVPQMVQCIRMGTEKVLSFP